MTPKLEFLQAVARMSPSEPFIRKVAELVPDDLLPPITGVAAFELVATLNTLCKSWRFRRPLRACPPKARRRKGLGDTISAVESGNLSDDTVKSCSCSAGEEEAFGSSRQRSHSVNQQGLK